MIILHHGGIISTPKTGRFFSWVNHFGLTIGHTPDLFAEPACLRAAEDPPKPRLATPWIRMKKLMGQILFQSSRSN